MSPPETNVRRELFVPLAGPPNVAPPSREIFAVMGEANIFRMLADFYRELGNSAIHALFPGDLVAASERSARSEEHRLNSSHRT